MAKGDVKYIITADATGAVTTFKKIDKAVDGAKQQTTKAKSAFSGMWKQMAAGFGITTAVTSGISAIKNAISDTIQVGREFEREWANVTTMFDTSKTNANDFKQELMDMSPVLGDTTELARGMYQVLSASIEPAKAIDFLTTAAEAATAGVTDTATAVDALSTVINAYGMEAENAGKVSDIMFATVKRGKLTYEQMATALGTVVPVAAQAGIEFEEIGAAMATLTRQGIDANTATMQLRQVMMAVLKPSKEASKLAKQLGIDWSAAGLKAKGLSGFLADVKEKTGGNVEAMTTLVPNVRALTATLALAGEQSGEFEKDLRLMQGAVGDTQEAFDKQMQSMDFWIKALGTAAKDAKISFYEGFVEPFKQGMQDAEGLADKSKDVNDTMRELGEILGSVALPALEDLIDKWNRLSSAFETTGDIAKGIWGSIKRGWIPTTANWTKAMVLAGEEMGNNVDTMGNLKASFDDVKGVMGEALTTLDAVASGWLLYAGVTVGAKDSQEDVNEAIETTVELVNTFYPKAKQLEGVLEGWDAVFKDLGILTIKQTNEKLEEAQQQSDDLKRALDAGVISQEMFEKGVKEINDRLKEINPNLQLYRGRVEELVDTTIQAGHDISAVWQDQDLHLHQLPPKVKQTTTEVESIWDTFTDGLRTKWATSFADMIAMPSHLRDDLAPIFQNIYDTFADMVGQMVSKWLVDFIGSFVSSTKDAAGKIVGSMGDVKDAALNLAQGFSPGGMIATAIGTAVGTFLAGLLSGGDNTRDLQLIKDNTWMAQQRLLNVVGNLDQIKWDIRGTVVPILDAIKLTLWDQTGMMRSGYTPSGGTNQTGQMTPQDWQNVGQQMGQQAGQEIGEQLGEYDYTWGTQLINQLAPAMQQGFGQFMNQQQVVMPPDMGGDYTGSTQKKGAKIVIKPEFEMKIKPQPVNLIVDGQTLAKAMARYTAKLTKRGLMKIHVNSLIGT